MWDALEATIQLVGWAKRERRRGRRKIRREMKKMGKYQNSDDDEHLREEKEWWEEHGCCGRDGEGSSEDCYSDSCSEEEDWLQYSRHRKSPGQIRAAPGEILNELLQKDPKLRMEKEDEVFAKQFLQQEEEEKRKEEEKDRELALKLQGDPEEKSKEEEKDHELALKLQEAQKKTPIKTRSKSYPEGVTHSVLDSFKRTPLTGAPATTAALSELCRDRSLAIAPDNTARKSPKGKKDVVAIDLTINDAEDEDQNTPTHANHSNKQYAVLQNAGDMTKNIFGQNDQSYGDEEVNSNNQNRAGSSSDHSKVATASAHEQSSVEYPLVTPPNDRSTVPQSFHLSKNPKHNSTTNKRKPEPNITSPFMSGSTKKLREPKHHELISAKEPEIRVNDKSVSEIMNMGFREEDAKRCLRDADGDIQLAVSMLLSDASES